MFFKLKKNPNYYDSKRLKLLLKYKQHTLKCIYFKHLMRFDNCVHPCTTTKTRYWLFPSVGLFLPAPSGQFLAPRGSHCLDFYRHRLVLPILDHCVDAVCVILCLALLFFLRLSMSLRSIRVISTARSLSQLNSSNSCILTQCVFPFPCWWVLALWVLFWIK